MTKPPIDKSALESLLARAIDQLQVPGAAVAIVAEDASPIFASAGVKRVGSDDLVGPDTHFGIGSITKGIAATALAILVDEGKVQWDDLVRKHVPSFHLADPLADGQVTVRDLLCHRTGVGRHEMLWYKAPWGKDEVMRRIGNIEPDTPIRSRYSYQNSMYLVAGEVIAAAAGCSWDQFVKQRLFDPLGMSSATFEIAALESAPDRACPHASRDGKTAAIPFVSYANIGAAGTINASVREMAQWARFQLNRGEIGGTRLVSEANLKETISPQIVVPIDDDTRDLYPDTMQTSYGLGWRIWDYRGQPVCAHGGETDGFTAQIALLPRSHAGLIILCNLSPTSLPQALRNNLFDRLLDLPEHDWNSSYLALDEKYKAKHRDDEAKRAAERIADTSPSRALRLYAGEYEDAAYGVVRVRHADSGITLSWSAWTCALSHWHYDVFATAADGEALEKEFVQFSLDAAGRPAKLRFLNREFRRTGDCT